MKDSLSYYSENIMPNSHIIKKDDLNWFGAIISKSKLNNINKLSFDAIVDLNQSHNQSLFFLFYLTQTYLLKVGFQAEFSNFLYNITLESKSIGFLEEKYLMIENILGL